MMYHLQRFFASWQWTACLSVLLFMLAIGESGPNYQFSYTFVFMMMMYNISQQGRIPGLLGLPVAATLGMLVHELRWFQDSFQNLQWIYQIGFRSCMYFFMACWAEITLQAKEQAEANAKTDSLTGLLNRDGFEDRLKLELDRIDRTQAPAAVICLDGDGFKSVNDILGHNVGDAYLKSIAKTLQSVVRGYDSVARWGGDEFLILLPGCDAEATCHAVQRMQEHLAAVKVYSKQGITWSAGAVVLRKKLPVEQVLQAADQKMYAAKKQGGGATLVEDFGEHSSPLQIADNAISL